MQVILSNKKTGILLLRMSLIAITIANLFAMYIFLCEIGKDMLLFSSIPSNALYISRYKKLLVLVINYSAVLALLYIAFQKKTITIFLIILLLVINILILHSAAIGTI
jgi:hypothetical protein